MRQGTMGTIGALPLAWFLGKELGTHWLHLLIWIGVFLIGTWSAQVFCRISQTQDHQAIVIDEVLGLGLAAFFSKGELSWLLGAFILFRFFDIVKLPPVGWIDRWSKKGSALESEQKRYWRAGLGVMLDDLLAGLQALLLLWIVMNFLL